MATSLEFNFLTNWVWVGGVYHQDALCCHLFLNGFDFIKKVQNVRVSAKFKYKSTEVCMRLNLFIIVVRVRVPQLYWELRWISRLSKNNDLHFGLFILPSNQMALEDLEYIVRVIWATFMMLLCRFWNLKASILIHCKFRERNDQYIILNFSFCVPQKN